MSILDEQTLDNLVFTEFLYTYMSYYDRVSK
jgi:hypothetical protein